LRTGHERLGHYEPRTAGVKRFCTCQHEKWMFEARMRSDADWVASFRIYLPND
jgi:hypothetical protein